MKLTTFNKQKDPNWNFDINSDIKTIEFIDEEKCDPLRNKLRDAGIYFPESKSEFNWTIRITSFVQGLLVLLMIAVQIPSVDYVNQHCCNSVHSLVHCLWSFIICSAISTVFNFLVTLSCFLTLVLIQAAKLFQYFTLFVWLAFFLTGITITLSNDPDVSQFERFLIPFIFACNLSAAAVGAYNASLLSDVQRLEAEKKIHSNPYRDVISKVLDAAKEDSEAKT